MPRVHGAPSAAMLVSMLLVALSASGCQESGVGDHSADGGREVVTVEWVVDGDTLRLMDGRQVRLLQIDAPEAATDCFGEDATRELVRLTPRGTRITLERDGGLDDRDRYDRLLRYVFLAGRNVNVALVERGAASPYYFRSARGRYAAELDRAAAEAVAARRGYWRACPGAELEPELGSVTGPPEIRRR